MIVSDQDAQKAFDFLKATMTKHAEYTAEFDALKKHENALIAMLKLKSPEKASNAKEDDAYNSPEYETWEKGMKAANFLLTKLENERGMAQTQLDIWRTESANARRL